MPESFSMKEQKIVVRYLKAQNTNNDDIYKLLQTAAGPSCVSYKDVRQWTKDIEEGKEDTDICTCFLVPTDGNLERLGPTDPALICRIENLINQDRRITIDKAVELSMSNEFAVSQIFTSVLTVRRVYERWIPRGWTPDQRTYRVAVAKELLEMYNYGDDFLSRLIVGDECFTCYHSTDGSRRPSTVDSLSVSSGLGSRRSSMAGSRRSSRVDGGLGLGGDKYRPVNEPNVVNYMMFYDMKGMIVSELMEEDTSPNPDGYATMMKNVLLPNLKRKRGHVQGQPIYILHDNNSLHESIQFQEMAKELNIKRLPHPPNSPDLEPHEYWLFKNLKKMLANASFKSRADIYTTIQKHLLQFTDSDYANSICQLPHRWERIVENDGMYLLN